MTGDAGRRLYLQNPVSRDAASGPPVGYDAGVIDAESGGCLRETAEALYEASDGADICIHSPFYHAA